MQNHVSYICHYNDEETLKTYLASSIQMLPEDELIFSNSYSNLSACYWDSEHRSKNDILVFVHQDIVFPDGWRNLLYKKIEEVQKLDPLWGVIGIIGAKLVYLPEEKILDFQAWGNITDSNGTFKFRTDKLPAQIDMIDACICIKQKGVLYFDPYVPNFHGAVEDLCYHAKSKGMGVWCINHPLHHWCWTTGKKWNTENPTDEPEYQKYMQSSQYLVDKWGLPIINGLQLWV